MKVSQARLQEATAIRDAALAILAADGNDHIMGCSDGRLAYRKVEHHGLSIAAGLMPVGTRERYLDIYAPDQPPGRGKVFSIRYWGLRPQAGSIPLTVVTFKPGPWRGALDMARAA